MIGPLITGLMAAGLSGLLRTILVDREKVADFVPVDVVINVMIVAAWKRGMEEGKYLKMPIQGDQYGFVLF